MATKSSYLQSLCCKYALPYSESPATFPQCATQAIASKQELLAYRSQRNTLRTISLKPQSPHCIHPGPDLFPCVPRSGSSIATVQIAHSTGGSPAEISQTAHLASPAVLRGPLQLLGDLAVAASVDGTSLCSGSVNGPDDLTCVPVSAELGGGIVVEDVHGGVGGVVVAGAVGAAVYSAEEGALREVAVFSGALHHRGM